MKRSEETKSKSGIPRGKNAAELTVSEQELRERIAQKAYELYEKRGHAHGCDVEDWLEAERLVVEQLVHLRSMRQRTPKRGNRSKPKNEKG